MKAISVLDKSIYNLIAAGEVVERPSSVVKELVENAVDAGAKTISITVENGGLSLIEVSDDGCGIAADDVKKAFLAHATSKVFSADDLFAIGTLGFRGEALSSIAAVSKVTLTTAVSDEGEGAKISLSQGIVENFGKAGCKKGTTVSVKDLFFNVPARKKFLKQPSGEASEITSVVQKLALSAPDVSFTLISNGVQTLHTQGLGLASAVFAVYGKDVLAQCLPVNWVFKDIEVAGFCGKPEFIKANRNGQTLILNGRYIKNATVESAGRKAYERFMTTRGFPFFVLNVKMPLDKIDVNVHPKKLEVRFSDANDIFHAVYGALLNALAPEEKAIPQVKLADEKKPTEKPANLKYDIEELIRNSAAAAATMQIRPETDFLISAPIKNPNFLSDAVNEAQSRKILESDLSQAKAAGRLFNTYLLLETGNTIFIVDQHAAHEMLLYKEFCNEFASQKLIRQDMLVPFVFTVNAQESEFFASNAQVFAKQGFELEAFGKNTFKINSIPAVLSQVNLKRFVDSVLSAFDSIEPDEKFTNEYLAKKACSAAVKAGEALSEAEIDSLKKELAISESLRCPHGRPVAVKLVRSEIEKWFSRV